MKYRLFTMTLVVTLSTSVSSWASSQRFITPDFFVETISGRTNQLLEQPVQESCRERIREIMCLVEPGDSNEMGDMSRPCLPGGEEYAHYFEKLYDNYPPAFQKMFCSLKVIFIEKQFFGTAYAGILDDDNGHLVGAKVGIRKSVLDEGLDLATWASWKEQLSFGGIRESYSITAGLPIVEVSSPTFVSDFLYFVIAHEFGHLFDFSNTLNQFEDQDCERFDPDLDCAFKEGSWGSISWLSFKRPKPENEFLNREGLCFYWCNGEPLSKEAVPDIYSSLYRRTNFISIYATTQAWDDFADSLAYFTIHKYLNAGYLLKTNQEESYDVIAQVTRGRFSKKYNFIEDFLNRANIVYP